MNTNKMQDKKKNPATETPKNDTGRKDGSRKAPGSEPKDSPKRHEEAPGRNAPPTRPTMDDSGRRGRKPEGENPGEEG